MIYKNYYCKKLYRSIYFANCFSQLLEVTFIRKAIDIEALPRTSLSPMKISFVSTFPETSEAATGGVL